MTGRGRPNPHKGPRGRLRQGSRANAEEYSPQKKPEILKPVYYRVLKDYPELIETINNRHEIYNRSIDELLELKEQGRALIICPAININARITSKNARLLDRLYKLGRQDAVKALPALREWGLL